MKRGGQADKIEGEQVEDVSYYIHINDTWLDDKWIFLKIYLIIFIQLTRGSKLQFFNSIKNISESKEALMYVLYTVSLMYDICCRNCIIYDFISHTHHQFGICLNDVIHYKPWHV